MKHGPITAEFLGGPANRILVLARHPVAFDGSCVLVCPPFAEEMNKSRRMVTELAHRLVANSIAVVIPDLFGTGDSEGEFAQASWSRWVEDLHAVESWIGNRGWRVSVLLGIRLGCILAAQYSLQRGSAARRAVFWQPAVDGARILDQFLRVRVAASLMRDDKESVGDLKQRLARGEIVEVAGYGVSPQLATELASLRLADQCGGNLGEVRWFEVLRAADASVPAGAAKTVETLRQRGLDVRLQTVVGEPFWASTEIVCLPDLIRDSLSAVSGVAPHA